MIRQASILDSVRLSEMWNVGIEKAGIPGRTGGRVEQSKFCFQMVKSLLDNKHRTFIMEKDGIATGFITGYLFTPKWGSDNLTGYIDFFYIEKNIKKNRHGLLEAMKLAKTMRDFFKRSGATEWEIATRVDPKLEKVYSRWGLRKSQTIYRGGL